MSDFSWSSEKSGKDANEAGKLGTLGERHTIRDERDCTTSSACACELRAQVIDCAFSTNGLKCLVRDTQTHEVLVVLRDVCLYHR